MSTLHDRQSALRFGSFCTHGCLRWKGGGAARVIQSERVAVQKAQVPAQLVREGLAIIGCTMTAIVEEEDDEEYSTDDGSPGLEA